MTDKKPIPLKANDQAALENDVAAEMRAHFREINAARDQVRVEGQEALLRLYKIATNDSGQCRYVAAFLLNLYNGDRFHFSLTDLRGLDSDIIDDCLSVLKLDARLCRNIHTYFANGCDHFEQLALIWDLKDHFNNH